jgi:protein-tyrosine phosphatase
MLNAKIDAKVSSAGIKALVGSKADEDSAFYAAARGFDIGGHRAKQLTVKMCHEQDLILVMEKIQASYLCKLSPESKGKIMLLGQWLGELEILDPYKKGRSIDEKF